MNPEDLIIELRSQLDEERRGKQNLIQEKISLQENVKQLLKQHEDDTRRIGDLLLENINLKEELQKK